MITDTLLNIFFGIVTFIFNLFTLPAFPLVLAGSINTVLDYLAIPIGIFRTFLGDTYLLALTGALIAYWLMSPIIHSLLTIYGLIRGSGKH